ncbi:MAG: TIGR00730 family Rossman fold protein [Caulobacteraceae bacterium]
MRLIQRRRPRLPGRRVRARRNLAHEGVRLVYGGGGVGLMGACAGRPQRRRPGARDYPPLPHSHERPLKTVETVVVDSMHQRKMMMFEAADAFAILPGGIGTLEEAIELLSWRRLGLHAKPIVFLDAKGFWRPLFHLFDHILDQNLIPPEFRETWRSVERVEDILPTLRSMPTLAFTTTPGVEEMT